MVTTVTIFYRMLLNDLIIEQYLPDLLDWKELHAHQCQEEYADNSFHRSLQK